MQDNFFHTQILRVSNNSKFSFKRNETMRQEENGKLKEPLIKKENTKTVELGLKYINILN